MRPDTYRADPRWIEARNRYLTDHETPSVGLTARIRAALDMEEIELEYQPITDADIERVTPGPCYLHDPAIPDEEKAQTLCHCWDHLDRDGDVRRAIVTSLVGGDAHATT